MWDFNYSWLNNDEYLIVLQIGPQMLRKVLNYHIYASKLQLLIYINREFLGS